MTEPKPKLGISGRIAGLFQDNALTPLMALLALLLGLFALMVTPREEEPQIDVTMADIFIAYPGASAKEVESLIATPAEQVVSEIFGLKHVYSVSKPGLAIITAEFEVGENRTDAIVRLYNKIYSNLDWLPKNLGVSQPIIKPKGIDDVPILTLTLWRQGQQDSNQLKQLAQSLEVDLKRVDGTRDIYTVGGADTVVNITLDPEAMAAYHIDSHRLSQALSAANQSAEAGTTVQNNQMTSVQAGQFIVSADTLKSLIVSVFNDQAVYLTDVADISLGPEQPRQYVWFGTGPAAADKQIKVQGEYDAVTIAIAKQPGTNAADIANAVLQQVTALKGVMIADDVQVTVTRNYGETADQKADTLIHKLIFVTVVVVLLVLFALGWREAIIVGVAVVITLLLMLFASWAWGFTLNRVSLFALIFSIGILVDDAIVVVENIHRHIQQGKLTLKQAIPVAVDEVGQPTILATLAVIAALLPMAFVSGLMGPYMSPIPINASMGMLLSLMVAYIVTPWMVLRMLSHSRSAKHEQVAESQYNAVFQRVFSPFLLHDKAARRRKLLWGGLIFLVIVSVGLAAMKLVILKMLPFDNKSEVQIVIDMPEGSPLEKTAAVTRALTDYLSTVADVTDYQAYVGTASPINFNGLVRQYYLREGWHQADIQINLRDKHQREQHSHALALNLREPLTVIAKKWDARIKVVEVPAGPPVLSPIVAELYGLNEQQRQNQASQLVKVFEQTDGIVDIDSSVEVKADRQIINVDRNKASLFGLSQQQIVEAIQLALAGKDVGYLHDDNVKYAIPLRLQWSIENKANLDAVLNMKLINQQGEMIRLSDVVNVVDGEHQQTLYHKDLQAVTYVTADMAGKVDSPLYGMFSVYQQLENMSIEQYLVSVPSLALQDSLKWDGEWQITYETFRDMGLAYAVGIILIYLLIVAQFRSYLLPLIIMVPIPLTVIGVMPGHALLGAPFTATSMIGMIAMAGIIVRNSILLVDFIRHAMAEGMTAEKAVIAAAATRAKPIILTALAAMVGAVFILDDPIFNGLAIALLFGILVSTLLTLLVIPLLYYSYIKTR
ncbi:efflux RND transporter permease subunit [Methylophaga thalassica]|uniref:efflux RND transporter permease subunit n=1 Tax=Methylophaga thalassica TaxID=40223 RepID=UPI002E7B8930|nr:efflux RND transporter permease subunit [Methylophaga thalassica]WVI84867.1 efflux RND transporter permease subunit [Methylophaga thalassica]